MRNLMLVFLLLGAACTDTISPPTLQPSDAIIGPEMASGLDVSDAIVVETTIELPLIDTGWECETLADCDTGDACLLYGCINHACVSKPVPGCCLADAECPASSPCMKGFCDNGFCAEKEDDNCCTDDAECFDASFCQRDTCDPDTGACVHEPFCPGACVESPAFCVPLACSTDADCAGKTPVPCACDGQYYSCFEVGPTCSAGLQCPVLQNSRIKCPNGCSNSLGCL